MNKESPAQIKAHKKYETEKVERIIFRVPKGAKDKLKTAAKKKGLSVAQLLNQFVDEQIKNL